MASTVWLKLHWFDLLWICCTTNRTASCITNRTNRVWAYTADDDCRHSAWTVYTARWSIGREGHRRTGFIGVSWQYVSIYDRGQTYRHTDTLIAIPRTPIKGRVTTAKVHSLVVLNVFCVHSLNLENYCLHSITTTSVTCITHRKPIFFIFYRVRECTMRYISLFVSPFHCLQLFRSSSHGNIHIGVQQKIAVFWKCNWNKMLSNCNNFSRVAYQKWLYEYFAKCFFLFLLGLYFCRL